MISVRSIQEVVTRRLLIGTLTAAVGANLGVYLILRHEVIEQFDASLEARARALTTMVIARGPGGPLSFPYAGRDQPEFRRRPGRGDYFQVWDAQGNVVARSPSLGDANLPRPPLRENTIGDRVYDGALPDGRDGHYIEVRFAPYVSNDDSQGGPTSEHARQTKLYPPARLVLASDRDELNEVLSHLAQTLGVVAIALVMTSVLIVVVVVRVGLRPLLRLAEDAAHIDADHLTFRFDVEHMPAELRPISLRLNDLLGRLEGAFGRERRFTADAAHELRTPIAELRSLAEVAIKWPPAAAEDHAANYRHFLAAALQMESVVGALLTLARHHAATPRVSGGSLALNDVVAEVWRSHEPHADQRGLRMQFDIDGVTIVTADRPLLIALLHNLFSNATSHAPGGSTITCAIGTDATVKITRLTLANSNTGLTDDDLNQLARPFWRKESSRTDSTHAGLGLALVNEYAAALGINCTFSLRDGDQFVVELTWPYLEVPQVPGID